jgi:hypothetical protein
MAGKKNLCAMIPAELHARIMAEKEEMKLSTLAEYVERIFTEHFEGGNDMQTDPCGENLRRTLRPTERASGKESPEAEGLHHTADPAGAG